MDCESCVFCNKCKQPNKNKPACLMNSRYRKAIAMAHVPKRYVNCTPENLPIEKDNPQAYKTVIKYCSNILKFVTEDCYSIYMYSVPDPKINKLGTGTGKTTCACAILNKFIAEYVWDITKKGGYMDTVPALFVRCADFQNKYAEQCRNQEGASEMYYSYKNRMKSCKLLVIDDIALRDCTEAFECELYEVIDHRVSEMLPTIYTSNVDLEQLGVLLGNRIASRIREDCILKKFVGKDHRDF